MVGHPRCFVEMLFYLIIPIIDVPDTCSYCGYVLRGTELMCPKCGHCVICG